MKVFLGLIALALFGAIPLASAQDAVKVVIPGSAAAAPSAKVKAAEPRAYASSTKGPDYYENGYELKARKLMRGVANVTLCVAEIPNQMFQEAHRSSPVSGAAAGVWKGLVKGSKRLAIGSWEIFTFYFEGNNHYQPYIEPEVVFGEYLR